MRPTARLLVKPRRPVRDTPPLLPPLVLYRSLLRANRKLGKDERSLGDKYIKSEFRAHKNLENPLHIVGFLTAWQDYLSMVNRNQNNESDWKKYQLKSEDLVKLSDEQIGQLYELMKETKNYHLGELEGEEGEGEGDVKN
ncbi:hypothetical protein CANARDRAFT_6646 [[Candida] arabinofermentans NRRL YB-2248]|uniref:Succinate dehydrogenase assembly factor 3 n=1 Tax=[Candida] arabinofermentans NRRL YB-2248 TaxID=983967 RepID=A0A1E4T328_9ASCO|nr:hypothetical protein CANARDRAFT_6646 [[Candida] arabinofermentans NRRL YB-2248]